MRGSIKLTTVAEIGIYMHWTFWVLIAWVAFSALSQGATIGAAAMSVLFVLAVFACVVLHELGHAQMARQFGINTRDITLLPIGGVARLERIPTNPWQEFWIAVAGPAVNVVIAVALVGLILALGIPMAVLDGTDAFLRLGFLHQLAAINILLVLFNMLPAFPMDGGRVLRALLAMRFDYFAATVAAARVGQVMAGLFVVLGLLFNPMLAFIAIFVFLAGRAEVRGVRMRAQRWGEPGFGEPSPPAS